MASQIELEGFDYAASLLKRYDVAEGCWHLPRDGAFWDAVRIARSQGKRGAGRTIAIIEPGFDVSMPALANARLIGSPSTVSAHGTAVALLVREVAPDANLLLISASVDGKLLPAAIADGIRSAVDMGAEIINLSLSVRIQLDEPGLKAEGVPYTGPTEGIRFDWRETLIIPPTPIGDAVIEAASRGVTVVAASGNREDSLSLPAALREAFSIGFLVVERTIADNRNDISVTPPVGYKQSIYSDFSLQQPQGVLGTSFATPLISGFCALMADTKDLHAYRDVVLNSSNADGFADLAYEDGNLTETAELIRNLYNRGLSAMPHPHLQEDNPYACPECTLYASSSYCNAGLFAYRLAELETAEHLLRTARAVAPYDADSAANLAMTLAAMADEEHVRSNPFRQSSLLSEAADHMAFAYRCRPKNHVFAARVSEFTRASLDPTEWHLGPISAPVIPAIPEDHTKG